MSSVKTVTDQNGIRYELTEMLGQGGQGSVYAVKGGRLAVKIITGTSPAARDHLRNQLAGEAEDEAVRVVIRRSGEGRCVAQRLHDHALVIRRQALNLERQRRHDGGHDRPDQFLHRRTITLARISASKIS